MGVREARRLIEEYGVRGFKFHPSTQGFYPNDRKAYALYEVIAGHKLPALFHTGQTGFGADAGRRRRAAEVLEPDVPRRRGGGLPRHAHHPRASVVPLAGRGAGGGHAQAQVYIDLSGWSPKYFPPNLVQYANTMLKHKVLFGSDFPALTPDR